MAMACKLQTKQFRLYLLTWNVGGKKPPENPEDLGHLLDLDNPQSPDIYGIGLQEVANGHYEFADSNVWTKALTRILGKRGYVRLKVRRMQGLMTLLFVRRKELLLYSNIESEVTKAGWAGWWGNKGGVSIRFELNGVDVIIVNCHLAAHRENVAERLEDYDTILSTQLFRDDNTDNILDHDMVFWIGDLNFRVDKYTREEVEEYITKRDYGPLLEEDQLLKCKENELILVDFKEGKIDFPPTYKFDKGTDHYDSSNQQRVPAWCDRVLWMVDQDCFEDIKISAKPTSYTSLMEYRNSDHKPVIASFDLEVPPFSQHATMVRFFLPKKLYINQENVIRYHVREPSSPKLRSSSWDWIGLYKEGFTHLRKYVSYTYAVPKAETYKGGVTLTLSKSMMGVVPGSYYLCYISQFKDTVCGMSKLIKVEP